MGDDPESVLADDGRPLERKYSRLGDVRPVEGLWSDLMEPAVLVVLLLPPVAIGSNTWPSQRGDQSGGEVDNIKVINITLRLVTATLASDRVLRAGGASGRRPWSILARVERGELAYICLCAWCQNDTVTRSIRGQYSVEVR